MFAKFEALMNKYMMPLAHKVDKQKHLSSIKAAMVAMTPFTILGSFFAIIPALPNMIGGAFARQRESASGLGQR